MRILPSCSWISTIVWLHHLDFYEALGGEVWWKVHKEAVSCSEHIIEAPHKTSAVWPLTYHHINHPSLSRHAATCLKSRGEPIIEILMLSLTHGHHRVDRLAKIHIHQLCADTGCRLEDLPREMDHRDGFPEIVKKNGATKTSWWWWWWWRYLSIYIYICKERERKRKIEWHQTIKNVFKERSML